MKRFAAFFVFCSLPLFCQSKLRLKITDPSGLPVRTTLEIISEGHQYRRTLSTNDEGALTLRSLPYGVYQLQIEQPGFAAVSAMRHTTNF
jgi:hypothetical protein